MLKQSVVFNSALLGGFALVTVGIVALTFQGTKDAIAESRLRAAQAALNEVVPAERHNNDLFSDTLAIPEDLARSLNIQDLSDENRRMHVARMDGEPIAVIVPTAAPDGYSGRIDMIMGVDTEGRILGLRVTSHNETPGLGDKIEARKSNWILSFNGKSAASTIDGLDADFDQLTGATITRQAITRQVKRTLAALKDAELFQEDAAGEDQAIGFENADH